MVYKLLIIEDEHLIRRWLAYAIDYSDIGLKVVGAAEIGQEGADMIRNYLPDIVISDINMPVMDAFEMFELTKDLFFKKIILSGYNDFFNAKKAIHYGVREFLAKPLQTEELRLSLLQLTNELENEKRLTNQKKYEALVVARKTHHDKDMIVHQVLSWIHEYYAQKFTIADIAASLGYSESYLYKKIKDHLDIIINDYVNRYRIKKAIDQLIEDPNVLIYEVADRVGFSDYKYFNKVFRRYIGVSVTEFKEEIL